MRDVKRGRERLRQLEPGQLEKAKCPLEVIGKEWEVALRKRKTFAESLSLLVVKQHLTLGILMGPRAAVAWAPLRESLNRPNSFL